MMPLKPYYAVPILWLGLGLMSWPVSAQTTVVLSPTAQTSVTHPVTAPSTGATASTPAQTTPAPSTPATPAARLQALQTRITEDAGNGLLKTEAVTALEGKQAELENQVSRLQGKTQVTADEQAALNFSIQQQEARLKHYEQAATPAHKVADPASVPPPTYVAPNGTTIIAPGGAYGNSGVVLPQNGPAMNPAPANLQPVPATNTPQ